MSKKIVSEEFDNQVEIIEDSNLEEDVEQEIQGEPDSSPVNPEKPKTTAKKRGAKKTRRTNQLNPNKTIYLYDFNGKLAGRFRGPTEAAKKLLGYDSDNADLHDSRKLSMLKTEISVYAKNNSNHAGVVFVQGYVPSYEELTEEEIVNNRRSQPVRGSKVLQYDFGGNLMNVFENANDAAEKLGKSTAWVSILCNSNYILRYDR